MSERAGRGFLSVREQARLAGILSRLASPFENERAIAGLLASAMVEKHGLLWSDVISLPQPRGKAPVSFGARQPIGERRHGSTTNWRGYCRRRRLAARHELNVLA